MSGKDDGDQDEGRPINSDALGAVGEGRFATICAGAELIANTAHRDRSGWDFIVEWPINHQSEAELDKRENPISAHFQLKSMWHDNNQIKFRMTSIERLAKDPKPSFVYITKFNHDQLPSEVFLAHIIGDNLVAVLRKLRELQQAGKKKINNEYIYMSATIIGAPIGADGKALRAAVEEAIGPDLNAYQAEKTRQLAELGYEPLRHTLDFRLSVQNEEEFTDALLGLKSDLPFSSAVNKETRFGIAIQTKDFPTEGKISFTPSPADTCSIIVRRNRFAVAATFSGTILMAPGLSDNKKARKIVISSELFKFILTDERLAFKSVDITPENPKLDSSQWKNWYSFVKEMTKEGCQIELHPKRLKKQTLNLTKKIDTITEEECVISLNIIDDINLVLSSASGAAAAIYGHAAIVRNVESARVCAALIRGDDALSVKMGLAAHLPEGLPEREYGRFIDTIVLDNQAVLAIASATFIFDSSSEMHSISAEDLSLQDLEIVPIDDLRGRVAELKSEPGAGICMVRNFGEAEEGDNTTT
ncbi:hypothetical protein [Methylobacterium sp. 1973]|uniref:hypothetical protein n=1 Tax=Methylobacterium sp. 1973 TaxID=3156421 RepID=UPI00339555EF